MLTLKQLFYRIAEGLLRQNAKAIYYSPSYGPSSVLVSEEGYKHAIGFALDEQYLEGHVQHSCNLASPALQSALRESGVNMHDPRTLKMLYQLTCLHDCMDPETWGAGLHRVAKVFQIPWQRPVTVSTVEEIKQQFPYAKLPN